jgi:V/A-type H+-transporting ATPase subunit F
MYKVVIVTDSETADGFRLAGVDVYEVKDSEQAREEINRLIDDERTGILAVNEGFLSDIGESLQERIESTYKPIVISLPVKEKAAGAGERKAYLTRLIHQAVGFDVTLKK